MPTILIMTLHSSNLKHNWHSVEKYNLFVYPLQEWVSKETKSASQLAGERLLVGIGQTILFAYSLSSQIMQALRDNIFQTLFRGPVKSNPWAGNMHLWVMGLLSTHHR